MRLRVAGTPRTLPSGQQLCAYRVAQEAPTNVLKHASDSVARDGLEAVQEPARLRPEVILMDIRLVGTGMPNGEIAARLLVSEATVKTHLNRLMSKLGISSRAQAVVVAYETGLVRPGR
ncbi:hypothetical protein GCM10027360_93010 [Amycolatopsis echigonensis]|uniref:response regulator transcription factor n=1 Tax=Amycolatopsis echigonensis TaxID=2576905 RepID=UPI003A520C6A